ncbi:MAG TPA: hypothetical protein EYP73_03335 [Acidimicrobiia bacterium]|nr:hypothetical protein [Acidimicrobiia bacterium]
MGVFIEVVVVGGATVVFVVDGGAWVAAAPGRLVPAPATTPPPGPPAQAASISERTARYLAIACLSTVAWLGRNGHNLGSMFGPLNGVRVALVIAAFVAALAAFVAGYTAAGLVLMAGVALHGLGWLYLYRRRRAATDPRSH